MATYSGRGAVIAYGRQTAEGSALTTPKFETAMGEGFVGPEQTTEELGWTAESQDPLGFYISQNKGVIDASLPVLPKSAGALLHGILGTRNTTGAGPYTHEFTPNDTLPWMTFFYAQPGPGDYWSLADAKLDTWELSAQAGAPLSLAVSGQGKTCTRAASKWSAATVVEGVSPFLTMIGAVIKLDDDTTPATTTVHNLSRIGFSVNRNLEAIQTDGIAPQYIAEQKRDIEVSLDDVVLEDSNFLRTVFTGSTSGTTLTSVPVSGSIEATFIGSDGTAAATRSLKVACPQVLWTIEQIPGADPSGAPARYTVTGRASKPSGGASITATLINAEAGTNY